MQNRKLFDFYKKGMPIGIIISPLCHPVLDENQKPTGKMECNEHSHTQDKLSSMITGINAIMVEHGFETHIVGSLNSMQRSIGKKLKADLVTADEAILFVSHVLKELEKAPGDLPTKENLTEFIMDLRDMK